MPSETTKSQKQYSRDELLEKIVNAKKSLCLIGATVFDLPWKELLDKGLSKKFYCSKNNFEINILRESENIIAQYALLSQSKFSDDGGSFSRGNFNGLKEDIVKELKGGLERYAVQNEVKNTGLEPPEDVFKKELTKISDDVVRENILRAVKEQKRLPELLNKIKERISSYLSGEVNRYWEQASKELGYGKAITDGVAEFQCYMEDLSKKIANSFSTIESLQTLDIESVLMKIDDKKCEGGKIKYPIKNNPEQEKDWIVVGNLLKVQIQEAISFFKINDDAYANAKLEFAREYAEKIASDKIKHEIEAYRKDKKTAQRLVIKDCYMPIPVPLIKIDNELFITQALTKFDSVKKFQYVGDIDSLPWEAEDQEPYRSYWITEFQNYYNTYFDSNGVLKYSTEETSKGDRKEVIDIFNESRVRIGTGPRDAFLSNMAIVKSVVWALIFDREGNILIHQRANNAKDNRGLWDKSVGGHVSVEDIDTIEAVCREITQEFYTIEEEGQSGYDKIEWLIVNKNKIIYLGEWKTTRYPNFRELILDSDEYFLFSLNYSDINKKNFKMDIVFTERVLPNGEIVKAKCFVDPYLCIVAENFDMTKLQNSKYAMLTPNELKTCVRSRKIRVNKDSRYYDSSADPVDFNVTYDLAYLVNSSIWEDIVTEFSKRIRDNFKNKNY